jgi:hypothetical protein
VPFPNARQKLTVHGKSDLKSLPEAFAAESRV